MAHCPVECYGAVNCACMYIIQVQLSKQDKCHFNGYIANSMVRVVI